MFGSLILPKSSLVIAYLFQDIVYTVLLQIHFCHNLRTFLGKLVLAETLLVCFSMSDSCKEKIFFCHHHLQINFNILINFLVLRLQLKILVIVFRFYKLDCTVRELHGTAVQPVFNPFSQFVPQLELYYQLQLSLWSDPIDFSVPKPTQ